MSSIQIIQKWMKSFRERTDSRYNFFKMNLGAKIFFMLSVVIPFSITFMYFVLRPLFIEPKELTPVLQNDLLEFGTSPLKRDLKINELFLQSQLQLAKTDSICIAIDLIDSTAYLQIRGVNVRECPIIHFKTSWKIKQLKKNGALTGWLSAPFASRKEWGTLPKSPIKIKRAPRDTVEANQMVIDTVTVEKRDAFIAVQFDRLLMIKINQASPPSMSGWIHRFVFNLRSKVFELIQPGSDLYHKKVPQHTLWIELTLSKNDVKAIFRALPKNAGLSLRL